MRSVRFGCILSLAVAWASVGLNVGQTSSVASAGAALPSPGYWLVASDGGIFSYGNAQFYGSTGNLHLNKPIVGMTTTPDGSGYWLVASDGGIFAFGNAGFYGSTGALHLNKSVVAMAATPDGGGYWLVASDGGIFAFGDAGFFGSASELTLSKPIVGVTPTPDGKGYWLVAADGGILSFGDAAYHGSTGELVLNSPIVGMASTPDGGGYWLVASDGGIFSFGDAQFYGSTGGMRLNRPVVGMASIGDGLGYDLVASDGGIFSFGDASFVGSTAALDLNKPIVGMALHAGAAQCPNQTVQVPGDPYSPPCLAFSGNNEGATSNGVTASSITISYRVTTDQSYGQTLATLAGAQLSDTNDETEQTILALVQYFNTHFQFYGRKIQVKFFNGLGSLSNELQGYGQAQAAVDANSAKSLDPFADLSAESDAYATALWNNGIMGFGDPSLPSTWHEQHAPYDWSVFADDTDLSNAAANYAVQKLCPAGTPAAYAGGSLQNAPRKFAAIAPNNEVYKDSAQVIQQLMEAHGCPVDLFSYSLDLGTESQQAANLVAQLKAGNYTTIICGCDSIFPVYLSGQAAQQNYLPEFVETGAALIDQDYVGQLYNQLFFAHAFGISPNPPPTAPSATAGYAAYKSVDPSGQPATFVDQIYEQMEMLAIGIEMAGPDLTPHTFQQGMFNYPAREGPLGLWGFSSQQYTTPNDVREVCWNPTAVSSFNGKAGAYQGTSDQRWTANNIPSGPPGCPTPS